MADGNLYTLEYDASGLEPCTFELQSPQTDWALALDAVGALNEAGQAYLSNETFELIAENLVGSPPPVYVCHNLHSTYKYALLCGIRGIGNDSYITFVIFRLYIARGECPEYPEWSGAITGNTGGSVGGLLSACNTPPLIFTSIDGTDPCLILTG